MSGWYLYGKDYVIVQDSCWIVVIVGFSRCGVVFGFECDLCFYFFCGLLQCMWVYRLMMCVLVGEGIYCGQSEVSGLNVQVQLMFVFLLVLLCDVLVCCMRLVFCCGGEFIQMVFLENGIVLVVFSGCNCDGKLCVIIFDYYNVLCSLYQDIVVISSGVCSVCLFGKWWWGIWVNMFSCFDCFVMVLVNIMLVSFVVVMLWLEKFCV